MNPLVVVLPVSRPDFHLAVKWLEWANHLASLSMFPQRKIIIFCAENLTQPQLAELSESAPGCDTKIAVCPEKCERPDLGYAYSANIMFRTALEYAEVEAPGSPVLWCEADTVPCHFDWVHEIEHEYYARNAVVMGDFHPHGEIPHATGNSVYPPDWRKRIPSFALLPNPRPRQGWDTLCAHESLPLLTKTKLIQQVWICPRFTESNTNSIVRPETALFHRCKDGSLIDVLAARAGIAPIPLGPALCPPTSVVGDPEPDGPRPPRVPRVAIMIVTYAKDMEFLRYCLKSIRQFAHGFAGVTLVVPEHERGQYDWVKGAEVRYFHEEAGKGMLAHEVQICRADEHCPNADFVLHMDADCMFMARATPSDYVTLDGRCLAVREHYSKITNQNRHIWKACVKNAVGIEPEFDAMLRHPQIHPVAAYAATRDMVTAHTGVAFDKFVMSGRNEFPQNYAEFPTISAVGWKLFPDSYQFVDYDKSADAALCGLPPESFQYLYVRGREKVVEWWSHGTVSRYKADCEAVLGGRCAAYYVK